MDTSRRWRLILGQPGDCPLEQQDASVDAVLEALYDADRSGSLGPSSPDVHRWLGDIRRYFPASVVQVMQKDALERLQLESMLLEPEALRSVEPDVHLAATLLSLKNVIPKRTRETAREVVRRVADDLQKRLRRPTRQAVRGALSKVLRTSRPRGGDIDFHRTILRNLRHYDPERRVLVPEKLAGHGRRRSMLRDVVLCVDQSGSMASSLVYSSIFAAVLASLPSLRTRMVVFDTEVADLTDLLDDPVEILFGTQPGGGTDIARALRYCRQIIERPARTVLVLISDLYEPGDPERMLSLARGLGRSGVRLIALLALNDEGAPSHNQTISRRLASLGIPAFACTPDLFPDLMSAALSNQDLQPWASRQGIVVSPGA